MNISIHAAERIGPINSQGDHVYKLFGRGSTGLGDNIALTVSVDKGTYEAMCKALMEDKPASVDAKAPSVLAIQVTRSE